MTGAICSVVLIACGERQSAGGAERDHYDRSEDHPQQT